MLISTQNLKRSFQVGSENVEALKGINLSVEKSEFLSIMGPSGSGKTTLMNIIGCLDTPTAGTYHLNNNLVNDLNDDELARIRNKEIGFVFQSFHLLAKNSALNNVMLPLKYAGVKEDNAIMMAKKVLDQVGLTNRINHAPSELSGGQQQRVAIARALVNNPSIIFADTWKCTPPFRTSAIAALAWRTLLRSTTTSPRFEITLTPSHLPPEPRVRVSEIAMTSRMALVRRRHTRKARLARSRLTARKRGSSVHTNALKRRSCVQRWMATHGSPRRRCILRRRWSQESSRTPAVALATASATPMSCVAPRAP